LDGEPRSDSNPGSFEEAQARVRELEGKIETLLAVIDRDAYSRQQSHDQVAHLFRISASVLVASELDEQLGLVAEGIVTACNFRRCVITLLDEDWTVWKRQHAGLSADEAKALDEGPGVSPAQRRSFLDEKYRVGNSYFIPHDSRLATQLFGVGVSSSRSQEEFVDWHPEDLLFVPLMGKDEKLLGTISVDDPLDGRRPTPVSLRILELFAREAAFAIEQNLLMRELSRTEGYLESLIRNSTDAIVTTDPEGKIVIWNEGAVRMLGWEMEEIVGHTVVRVYANEEEARSIMRRLMSGDEGDPGRLSSFETVLVSKVGERIPVALSVSALYGADGEFLGTAGISRDLRPWKRLEQELVAAEKAATLGEVAATLCHEINNFLEEILSAGQVSLLTLDLDEVRKMYGDAGKGTELDSEVQRLTVISREALKIASLTNRLQAMARGGAYDTTEYVGDIRMASVPELGERVGARILVADDRQFIREFLRDFLVLEGFQVDVACDGEEALQKAKAAHYDLVLSDIKMPHRNGYEVFAGVRETDPGTKVILMTAYGYDPSHSIVKASDEGLSDVLYKPFQMARVRDAIVKALSENGVAGDESTARAKKKAKAKAGPRAKGRKR
jgi:PAS domain S-box-containing protein